MKIAITGSGGFIGKNLLLDLSPDYQITAFARGGSVPEFVDNHSLSGVEVALCDLPILNPSPLWLINWDRTLTR